MDPRRWSRLILACSPFLAMVARADDPSPDPSARELIAMAPVIASVDGKYRSIEVRGRIRKAGIAVLKFRALYRAPDRHAVLLCDGEDDTPLLFCADRKMFVYDPAEAVVQYAENVFSYLAIWCPDDNLRYFFGYYVGQDDPSRLLLDIKSIYSGSSMDEEVVRVGEGKYRLVSGEGPRGYLVSLIDRSREQPFTGLMVTLPGDDEPMLCVDTIVVDGELGDEEFAFPGKERLAEGIDVRAWPDDGGEEVVNAAGSVLRACYIRLAALRPELREAGPRRPGEPQVSIRARGPGAPGPEQLPDLTKIDWEKVRANDRKYSKALKAAIPPGFRSPAPAPAIDPSKP